MLGLRGGLDEHSRPGEVIVAEEVLAAGDGGTSRCARAATASAVLRDALREAGLSVRTRADRRASRRLARGERREQLRAAGALAVDMESPWLAAGAAGRPFGVVRVVLDSPSHELLRPQALRLDAARGAGAGRAAAVALHDWEPGGLRYDAMAVRKSDRARAWAGTSSASALPNARSSR